MLCCHVSGNSLPWNKHVFLVEKVSAKWDYMFTLPMLHKFMQRLACVTTFIAHLGSFGIHLMVKTTAWSINTVIYVKTWFISLVFISNMFCEVDFINEVFFALVACGGRLLAHRVGDYFSFISFDSLDFVCGLNDIGLDAVGCAVVVSQIVLCVSLIATFCACPIAVFLMHLCMSFQLLIGFEKFLTNNTREV